MSPYMSPLHVTPTKLRYCQRGELHTDLTLFVCQERIIRAHGSPELGLTEGKIVIETRLLLSTLSSNCNVTELPGW